jgi:hypothetical protein
MIEPGSCSTKAGIISDTKGSGAYYIASNSVENENTALENQLRSNHSHIYSTGLQRRFSFLRLSSRHYYLVRNESALYDLRDTRISEKTFELLVVH